MSRNIVGTTEFTITWAWSVACEGGCGLPMTAPMWDYVPVDPDSEDAGYIKRIYTAPYAIRCISCGPFPA